MYICIYINIYMIYIYICILYIVHCTLYIVHCTLYIVYCILYMYMYMYIYIIWLICVFQKKAPKFWALLRRDQEDSRSKSRNPIDIYWNIHSIRWSYSSCISDSGLHVVEILPLHWPYCLPIPGANPWEIGIPVNLCQLTLWYPSFISWFSLLQDNGDILPKRSTALNYFNLFHLSLLFSLKFLSLRSAAIRFSIQVWYDIWYMSYDMT